jgi:hypothetical protein
MNRNLILFLILFSLLFSIPAAVPVFAQGPASANSAYTSQPAGPAPQSAVSYASVSQLNGLLSQLESASKTTLDDLGKLRIERWKADASYKKQSLSNSDSIHRNLQDALPGMIATLRNTPEDMPATFKLYRNLDALYDVLGTIVESTGAFGSKDDFQALSNDLSTFETTRKQVAERIETLSASKEAEIVRLRADLKTAQAAIPVAPPKKIVVDDNEPVKKPAPAKKKPAAKSGTSTTPAAKPAAGQTQTPPAQQPAKPQ